MSTELTANQIRRALNTASEMLTDRGYTDDFSAIRYMVDEDVKKMINMGASDQGKYAAFDFIASTSADNSKESIKVVFVDEVKNSIIKSAIDDKQNLAITHFIFVAAKIPASAHSIVNKFASQGTTVEFFLVQELLVNPTKHYLVPKHEPVPFGEKEAILKGLNATEAQLARIKLDDPISRWFGLKAGQLIRIYRKSNITGTYVVYRIAY